jgi:hypothetical protein
VSHFPVDQAGLERARGIGDHERILPLSVLWRMAGSESMLS